MPEPDYCAFCDLDSIADRTIRVGEHIVSFISKPAYCQGQALVIPRRHISTLAELLPEESLELMQEAGRIAGLLDTGFGAEIHQKFAPAQPENGIKMKHLHFHIVPKLEEDKCFMSLWALMTSMFLQMTRSLSTSAYYVNHLSVSYNALKTGGILI